MYSQEELDLARLAMCLDCEGCISVSKIKGVEGPSYRVFISISNTNPDLINWLRETFGFSISIGTEQLKKSKVCANAILSSSKATSLLEKLKDFLIVKREKAELAISIQDTIKPRYIKVSEETYRLREEIYSRIKELPIKTIDTSSVNRSSRFFSSEVRNRDRFGAFINYEKLLSIVRKEVG